ncbi:hypothetical protein [Haloechinothrix alba]|uniref:hypothetical protein n=1 Tax=Haloechinothrix alba TaxID=664784 RepID=UPI003182DF03
MDNVPSARAAHRPRGARGRVSRQASQDVDAAVVLLDDEVPELSEVLPELSEVLEVPDESEEPEDDDSDPDAEPDESDEPDAALSPFEEAGLLVEFEDELERESLR